VLVAHFHTYTRIFHIARVGGILENPLSPWLGIRHSGFILRHAVSVGGAARQIQRKPRTILSPHSPKMTPARLYTRQRPIANASVTGTGGTYTFTDTAAQLAIGKIQLLSIDISLTMASGAPTQATATYPWCPSGRPTWLAVTSAAARCAFGDLPIALVAYDGTTPASTGTTFTFEGCYEIA
jgi:hypothetical protein